jgi:hypothetical protein
MCRPAATALCFAFAFWQKKCGSFLPASCGTFLKNLLADLAITTGGHTSEDVLKGLMAGAKVTMMASELPQNGVRRTREVLNEMEVWMAEREYSSVTQMIGSMSQQHCAEPVAFERANYMKTLDSYQPVN